MGKYGAHGTHGQVRESARAEDNYVCGRKRGVCRTLRVSGSGVRAHSCHACVSSLRALSPEVAVYDCETMHAKVEAKVRGNCMAPVL